MSVRGNWQKFWALSPAYRSLILQAMVLLPLVGLGLRCLGFRRLRRLLGWGLGRAASSKLRLDWAGSCGSVARLVQAVAAHSWWPSTCLQRSLVLWWLLQRRGVRADLRIGVSRQHNRLEAHAWVEYDGTVLGDRADIHQTFAPFTDPIP